MPFPCLAPDPTPGFSVFSWFTVPYLPFVTTERVGVALSIVATLAGP